MRNTIVIRWESTRATDIGECEQRNFANRDRFRACTTSSSGVEYVMGDEGNLKDEPPLPPSPERRTEVEKKRVFLNIDGHHITPRKRS
jgi:hypothetical protein